MKRIIILALALLSSNLFANPFRLTDYELTDLHNNYNFIDKCKCEISSTVLIEHDEEAVLLNSNDNTIYIYSKNPDCSLKAEQCKSIVNTDNVIGCKVYSLD